MSEKVLGFYKKDALVDNGQALVNGYAIEKDQLVPVVLKKEHNMVLEENKVLKKFLKYVCNQNNINYESVWKKIKPDKWRDYLANIIKA